MEGIPVNGTVPPITERNQDSAQLADKVADTEHSGEAVVVPKSPPAVPNVPELSNELQRVLKPVSTNSEEAAETQDVEDIVNQVIPEPSVILNDQQAFAQSANQFMVQIAENQFEEAFHSLLMQKNALQRIARDSGQRSESQQVDGVYSYEDSKMLLEINELKFSTCITRALSQCVSQRLGLLGSGAAALGGAPRASRRVGRGGRRGGRRRSEESARASGKTSPTAASPTTDPNALSEQIDWLCGLLQKYRLITDAEKGEPPFRDGLKDLEKLYVAQVSVECEGAMATLAKQRRFRNQQEAVGGGPPSESGDKEDDVYEVALRLLLGSAYTPLVRLSELFVNAGAVGRDNSAVSGVMDQLLRDVAVPLMVKVLDAFSHDKMVEEWAQLCKAEGGNTEMDVKLLGSVLRELVEIVRLCKEFLTWVKELVSAAEYQTQVTQEDNPIHTLSVRVDYMLDAYTAMEVCWFQCNAKKAAQEVVLTEHGFGDTVQVYSIVENTFYVAKSVSWVRAEHTTVGHAMCAVANTICQYLGDKEAGYTRGITDLILDCRKSVGGPGEAEDANASDGLGIVRSGSSANADTHGAASGAPKEDNPFDAFDAILREETHGVSVLRAPRLFAINSAELSVLYLSQLAHEISNSFMDSSVASMVPLIGMALDTLKETALYHDQLRLSELRQVAESSLSTGFDTAIGTLIRNTSYEPNHGTFARIQREDPFMSKFVQQHLLDPGCSLQLCARCLSSRNFFFVLSSISKHISKTMEKFIFKTAFNELGALLLDTDLSLLIDSLVSLIPQGLDDRTEDGTTTPSGVIRSNFNRLRQIATIVGFNELNDVSFGYPLTPVLTEAEVREMLALRFARSSEAIELIRKADVSRHVSTTVDN